MKMKFDEVYNKIIAEQKEYMAQFQDKSYISEGIIDGLLGGLVGGVSGIGNAIGGIFKGLFNAPQEIFKGAMGASDDQVKKAAQNVKAHPESAEKVAKHIHNLPKDAIAKFKAKHPECKDLDDMAVASIMINLAAADKAGDKANKEDDSLADNEKMSPKDAAKEMHEIFVAVVGKDNKKAETVWAKWYRRKYLLIAKQGPEIAKKVPFSEFKQDCMKFVVEAEKTSGLNFDDIKEIKQEVKNGTAKTVDPKAGAKLNDNKGADANKGAAAPADANKGAAASADANKGAAASADAAKGAAASADAAKGTAASADAAKGTAAPADANKGAGK